MHELELGPGQQREGQACVQVLEQVLKQQTGAEEETEKVHKQVRGLVET